MVECCATDHRRGGATYAPLSAARWRSIVCFSSTALIFTVTIAIANVYCFILLAIPTNGTTANQHNNRLPHISTYSSVSLTEPLLQKTMSSHHHHHQQQQQQQQHVANVSVHADDLLAVIRHQAGIIDHLRNVSNLLLSNMTRCCLPVPLASATPLVLENGSVYERDDDTPMPTLPAYLIDDVIAATIDGSGTL